jgi:hypothetical protein
MSSRSVDKCEHFMIKHLTESCNQLSRKNSSLLQMASRRDLEEQHNKILSMFRERGGKAEKKTPKNDGEIR